MTSRHDELQERYQDALFALLMNEYVQKQGQKALEENERLKKSHEIKLSQTFDKKIRRQIRHYWGVYKHKSGRKSLKKIVKHVGMVLCAAVMLTMTVFAAFPELKIKVMNLWLDITDKTAEFRFFDDSDSTEAIMPQDDFVVTWLPEGYELESTSYLPSSIEYNYTSSKWDDRYIYVLKYWGDGMSLSVDTEDAEIKNMQINEMDAMMIQKDILTGTGEKQHEITILWWDVQKTTIMHVTAVELSERDIIRIAEGIQLD